MIVQVANAACAEDCHRLVAIYDRHVHLTNTGKPTEFPVVYWPQFHRTSDGAEIVPRLVDQCLCLIGRQLQLSGQLLPETVILSALGVGGCHSRHADNCRQNEQGDWVANHTPQRDVSAIYYLNDEFDGGEIVFERSQLMIKPQRGLLLAFPSDADHAHEVLPVRSGIRFAMPIWFTKQRCFAIADFSGRPFAPDYFMRSCRGAGGAASPAKREAKNRAGDPPVLPLRAPPEPF